MADTSNLSNFLTDVADAIRLKKNTQKPISPENFDNEIKTIQTGTGINWSEIGYSGTPQAITEGFNYAKEIYDNWDSSVTSVGGKFQKNTNLLILPMIDTSNVTNFTNFCADARHLIYIPLIDTSKATTLQGAFSGVTIIDFPALDTSSCTNFSNTFSNNKSLNHFSTIDTSNGKNFSNMFKDCEQLQDVDLLDLSSATNLQNMFSNCNQLTDYSLNNIMAMCIGATAYTGKKTLRQLGLNSNKATRATQLENYQAFLDAGWTTGYTTASMLSLGTNELEDNPDEDLAIELTDGE